MLVQVTPNLILNKRRISFVEKVKDKEIKVFMSDGHLHRLYISMDEFMHKINSPWSPFILNEEA